MTRPRSIDPSQQKGERRDNDRLMRAEGSVTHFVMNLIDYLHQIVKLHTQFHRYVNQYPMINIIDNWSIANITIWM